MDRQAVLAAFDEQIRRHPEPDVPEGHVERDDRVTRSIGGANGWTGVTWSMVDDASADAVIAEITDLTLDISAPHGVELQAVVDEQGVAALVWVHDQVFGGDHSALGNALLAGLARRPSTTAAVVALAAQTPIAAGRVEFHLGTEFASLWGGGTLPAWRRRGVFRSLVAHRATLASARGFRHLQVDASPESRPILEQLGFVELATTTPFTHPGTAG